MSSAPGCLTRVFYPKRWDQELSRRGDCSTNMRQSLSILVESPLCPFRLDVELTVKVASGHFPPEPFQRGTSLWNHLQNDALV